ncbi:hypothetical protein [Cohnella nanjingensis]|uniref:Uncharacterized protein n=1 Tax=Cohnella nanjingensis TaxID=1387779 RepID=A0A7X0RSS1_9BACL|nr:hypothetical protein [Cohnella nanjingensis]MBB6672992.1 hypothetical protein [Cohnella nanjingensis]
MEIVGRTVSQQRGNPFGGGAARKKPLRWEDRIQAARRRGTTLRRLYRDKPLHVYRVSFTRPSGHKWDLIMDAIRDEAHAIERARVHYEAVEIHRVAFIGYMPLPH